jgi:hypothetical protein
VKRYITEVIAQNVILLGGTSSNGNGSADSDKGDHRSKPGKPVASRRGRAVEPENVELDADTVPF